MGVRHNYTATGTNDGAKQVSKDRWNEDHIISGEVTFPDVSSPAAPSSGNVNVFGRSVGGRMMFAFKGPSGLDATLQPHIGKNPTALWQADGNSTTITAIGAAALTATGTATAHNWASTNIYTQARKLEYLATTAATTAVAGFRGATAKWWRGNAAGLGGFHMICRFAPCTGVTTSTRRCFVGMANSTAAPTDVQPSSITNILGVGYDAADTNWQIMYNDGSGTATKVDTGMARPSADRTDWFELVIFCPPNGSTIYFQFTNLGTGVTYTANTTTDIPSNTTALAPRGWCSVGGTSSVVGIGLGSLYIESDN